MRTREASVVAICHPPASSFRAVQPCPPHRQPERYAHRRPERTPLYRIIARNLETWLAERSPGDHPVATYGEEELRAYLRCGILSCGFARARCGSCGHDFLVAFSCKRRGVCPSCNGRRMAQTAAHLVDHVIPPVPVRQWVISVPKRLRWFLAERAEAIAALTTIFVSEVERLTVTGGDDGTTERIRCPACSGDIRLIAFIIDPGLIRKILRAVGKPVEPPRGSPAREPPTDWHELVQAHDDRDVMQAEPDEFPVIDIHTL